MANNPVDSDTSIHTRWTLIQRLKTRIKPKHDQIFYLLTVKEMTPSQAATTLDVPLAQVYLVRHRVARLFRKALQEAEAR